MNSKMDLNIFRNKMNDGIVIAIEYKNKFVPSTLYKYVPLLIVIKANVYIGGYYNIDEDGKI
ncbi:hypothetical protein [Clostridium sp. ATCC 25772]|uniref:hypothetical protein n=1 Tax=Clostridium sp. ATCC 25772 TaxID=1676991 RepID=UPI00078199AD|nr:hypothetical protein [Clostridium sp. ATCC 25772]